MCRARGEQRIRWDAAQREKTIRGGESIRFAVLAVIGES